MKKITYLFTFFISFVFSQQQNVTYSVAPSSFEENQSITITINGNSINEATWGVTGNALYLWAWSFDTNDTNILDCPTNGSWTSSNEANRLTYNAGPDTYTMTFVPNTFYARTGIGRIGFLVKAKDGTGDKKSQDILIEVGAFQSTLVTPAVNSTTILNSGGNLSISANNNNGNANYNLKANGASINSVANVSSYSFNHTNITTNQNYELEITQGAVTQTKTFAVVVNPGAVTQALPNGMEIGINYNASDNTKATLVLNAPGKDFVYVAGSFNNWNPSNAYAMKKDTSSEKFWLELTGLTPGQIYTYQYWVVDQTPIANSPSLVKAADPCSTLVLSPYDDPYIPSASYPNLPTYPAGQEREVTVLQTAQTPYNWQVTNFTKPNKDNLVVYELLVRDFDADRNYQDVIDKIMYLKNLGITAIELMPVMEFEGNESWGYNTSFHMALDKFYGTEDKLRELVDVCHQNGIAVILDIAFNHAFGRNPMVRMWMNDPDGDGWGSPSTDNPYFNTVARHTYSVGEDFNHASTHTKEYVKRTLKHWITDFKIDGFRWDLTKGFTQNCTSGDESCTNAYQQDRIDVLKEYVDYTWSLDTNHYAIFEHLGSDNEEQQWANYRLGEGKGIMMWGEMFFNYKELAKGYATNGDISRIGHVSRGFSGKRLIGYPESHDKDRLMYEAVTFGNAAGAYPVNGNLTNALNRMASLGAISVLVPGPKMIWHFQELGMDDSIYTCTNGTVNSESDPTPGDCKLATKPQPQWVENWASDPIRGAIYDKYARMIALKTNEPVFNGDYAISPDGNNVRQRIYVYDNSLPTTQLKNVVILANFSVADLTINPNFPYTGTWYDLMTDAPYVVTNTTTAISIPSGQFRIFGNQPSTLSTSEFEANDKVLVYPNPAKSNLHVSLDANKVAIYTITGQLVKSFNSVKANQSLPIEDIQKGIYFITIINSDNTINKSKFSKD
ncbi:alpha-amylase family glycosyl hydrolase [Flavobacterium sp. NRK F7]|uniref:alpha-amylase family glycosyl hydrolase n=1 Tax=Flavobacterium sp. NRK F7 TaxID=2954930 RepID=UPI0020906B2F|nr:alpha-amylase family glycosyl hydrolase [Flavobacterium sp. NRK F7]MCO6161328.1 alpha-amylase family glycosyl hydrolase [Flavobacterium sp. NRK F7]